MASVKDSGLAEQRLNFGDICKFKNVNSPTWSKKGCFKLRRWRSRRMKKSSEHEATPRLAELSGD